MFGSQGCCKWKAYVQKSEIAQPIYEIHSKVNQANYTLVYNCIPNIKPVAQGVLQIFCSQDCSYI